MKVMMTVDMWKEVEAVLAKNGAGYKVDFDNHHGIPEMLISIDTIGVMRREEEVKYNERNSN
jgi:hypothetical protein